MGGKAEYRSAVRSKKLIKQAYVELIKEKDIDKITIKDVVAKADILTLERERNYGRASIRLPGTVRRKMCWWRTTRSGAAICLAATSRV